MLVSAAAFSAYQWPCRRPRSIGGRSSKASPPAGGATWQRCQFHLARNAIHHAPTAKIRKRIGRQLKSVWMADDITRAETALAELVVSDRDTAPRLAD